MKTVDVSGKPQKFAYVTLPNEDLIGLTPFFLETKQTITVDGIEYDAPFELKFTVNAGYCVDAIDIESGEPVRLIGIGI